MTDTPLNWSQGVGAGAQPVYVYDSSGARIDTGAKIDETAHSYTPPGTAAGGSSTDVQYNNGGAFAGNGYFTYNGTTIGLPDGASWDSTGLAGLARLAFVTGRGITDGSASVSFTFPGSGRIDVKVGSTELMQFGNNSGAGLLNINSGGVIGFGPTATPDSGFSRIGAAHVALGNGTATDATGSLDLKSLTASHLITLPDGGSLGTSVNNIGGYLSFTDLEFFDPTSGPPGGSFGVITSGWVAGTGLSILGSSIGAGAYITPKSSYGMAWDLQVFNSYGFQVFGIENSAENNHSLQIGALRASTNMIDLAQLLFTDVSANGAMTGLGSLVGGSGYVDGTYLDVPVTGSATGDLGKLDFTVSGGVVTAAVLHPIHPRGGFWFHVGDVLGVSNAHLGGSGSGFSITVTSVSSGAAPGPVILMQSPIDFVGFGQAAIGADAATTENAIRFGAAGNTGVAWDTNPAAQPALTMGGALILGSGLTEIAQLIADTVGVKVTLPGSATLAPIKAAYTRTTPVTVAQLATLDASPQDGDSAFVTDALAPTFNGVLVGGGAIHTRVHYDSSGTPGWKAG